MRWSMLRLDWMAELTLISTQRSLILIPPLGLNLMISMNQEVRRELNYPAFRGMVMKVTNLIQMQLWPTWMQIRKFQVQPTRPL